MKKSYRASSSNRDRKDHYPTYYSLTEQLLEKEEFPKILLEPCCGKFDAVGKVLREKGFSVESRDLWFGPRAEREDFLCRRESAPGIVTNPPLRLADDFLETALRIVEEKFAFLLPLDYVHGQARYNRFYRNGIGLSKIYTFTRRPLFGADLREDGKYPTGSTTFSWFVFERDYSGLPVLDWIDNHEYVLRARSGRYKRESEQGFFSL